MSLYRDNAVVLRTYKMGEADRIVVLFTEHHGKVRAVANGVRRTSSKFGARLEPLSNAALLVWHGRGELDIVNQAEVIDHFRPLREDLGRLAQGLSMLEAVDQLSQEAHSEPRLYTMLVGALRALADPGLASSLVPAAFFLKVLVLEGAAPVLEGCASCGRPDTEVELVAFDLLEGGALCRSCRHGRPMSEDALVLMRRILGGELAVALQETSPVGGAELIQLATDAMESHLDRRLRAVHTAHGL
ncbi:MAG: DNA repair protein RecO [Acidimicrobiales bacterium]